MNRLEVGQRVMWRDTDGEVYFAMVKSRRRNVYVIYVRFTSEFGPPFVDIMRGVPRSELES